jgi:hypothetical protein
LLLIQSLAVLYLDGRRVGLLKTRKDRERKGIIGLEK